MVVRVFVAGGAGVLGRRLVPQLVARGHEVTATATSAAKLGVLARLDAEAVVRGRSARRWLRHGQT
ncbi:MAG TPA: NAD-dependent epimerase/dehydratase family protein [Micromonosporaceae bacterium]|nr:NAD-dependent epimerase/dehydratase family protein [Micromonosporaceae bacterium]